MSETVRIKPAGKNLLRNPDGMGLIPSEGQTIVLNSYWRRRISDGDAVVIEDADTKEKK